MIEKKLLPSLLSADFFQLDRELADLEAAGVTHLHLDIMDGHFVPNISYGPAVIQKLRSRTSLFFDAHLMVEEPDFLLPALKEAGCQLVTVHWEAVTQLQRTLQLIHSLGMQVGLALNPATPLECLSYLWPDIDLLLIMSVNPGFGGQSFIPAMEDKIRDSRRLIDESGREIILEVDGGIREENAGQVLRAGADWLVAGSAVFQPGQTRQRAEKMMDIIHENG